MTPEKQMRALAELDGIRKCDNPAYQSDVLFHKKSQGFLLDVDLPNYLTSYDAIIPLLQKQDNKMKYDFSGWVAQITEFNPHYSYDVTTAQLCEALLRATGKWEDQ